MPNFPEFISKLAAAVEAVFSVSEETLDFDVQDANKVLAGPATGAAAKPTVRSLVDADLSSAAQAAITASHARSHAVTSTSDHTSAATSGRMLKADASGLPVDATNTDTAVAAAVTASHANVTLGADADVLLGLSTQQLTFDTQTANTILAGPTTGVAADPTFRALVAADIPAVAYVPLCWGVASGYGLNFNSTRYFGFGGSLSSSVETATQVILNKAGTINYLRVWAPTNTLDGATVVTLRVGAADKTLTLTINAGATGGFTDAHSVAIAAGDLVGLKVVTAGTVGTLSLYIMQVDFIN